MFFIFTQNDTSVITLNGIDANAQNFLGHVHHAGQIHLCLFWDDNSGLDINRNADQKWSISIKGKFFSTLVITFFAELPDYIYVFSKFDSIASLFNMLSLTC